MPSSNRPTPLDEPGHEDCTWTFPFYFIARLNDVEASEAGHGSRRLAQRRKKDYNKYGKGEFESSEKSDIRTDS